MRARRGVRLVLFVLPAVLSPFGRRTDEPPAPRDSDVDMREAQLALSLSLSLSHTLSLSGGGNHFGFVVDVLGELHVMLAREYGEGRIRG